MTQVYFKKTNVEEIILPNEPLNNFLLIKAAKKLKLKHFKGVFVRDQLSKNTQRRMWNSIYWRFSYTRISLGLLVQRWR